MASVNKVIVMGNLGSDPEVRFTAGGQAVATLSVATSERWKNKATGQPEEKTEWHRVVLWGRLAELAKEYLKKGRTVYIEGRLQTRKWQDKDGQTKYTTEIIGGTMQFVGGGTGRSDGGPSSNSGMDSDPVVDTSSGPPPFGSDDDIPF